MKWFLVFIVVFAVTAWCTRIMLEGSLVASVCVGLASMIVVAIGIRVLERS